MELPPPPYEEVAFLDPLPFNEVEIQEIYQVAHPHGAANLQKPLPPTPTKTSDSKPDSKSDSAHGQASGSVEMVQLPTLVSPTQSPFSPLSITSRTSSPAPGPSPCLSPSLNTVSSPILAVTPVATPATIPATTPISTVASAATPTPVESQTVLPREETEESQIPNLQQSYQDEQGEEQHGIYTHHPNKSSFFRAIFLDGGTEEHNLPMTWREVGVALYDRLTQSTHEERERYRREYAEVRKEEQKLLEDMKQVIDQAIETGQPQYLYHDVEGYKVFVEPPAGRTGDRNSNTSSHGYYEKPNVRFVRPSYRYDSGYTLSHKENGEYSAQGITIGKRGLKKLLYPSSRDYYTRSF